MAHLTAGGSEIPRSADAPPSAYGDRWRSVVPSSLSLGGLSLRQLASKVWSSANDDDIVDRAAELAYYFLFALFPGLIFLSSMFGMIASTASQLNFELMYYLAKVIPPDAFGLVLNVFNTTTKASSTGKLTFGAVTALWSATYGMASAQSTLNVVYRLKESRPFWKARLIALGLTLAVILLAFSAMLLSLFGGFIARFLINDALLDGPVGLIWKAIEICISLFFFSLVFSLTYRWAPDLKQRRWRWITPGSIVGISGWVLISMAFRFYLHYFNSYAVMYGTFGAVIILLTWFYVSGLMLLLGAEINVIIERAAVPDQLSG